MRRLKIYHEIEIEKTQNFNINQKKKKKRIFELIKKDLDLL